MPEILILSLADTTECRGHPQAPGDECARGDETPPAGLPERQRHAPRVPVLACADALRSAGASVDLVTAGADVEIDAAIATAQAAKARLIVAAGSDGEIRAVVRRLVRSHAPPPSKRPAHLPPDRTMFDLPPLGVLPLHPAVPALVGRLGLPTHPQAVAQAVVTGRHRRLDLLRTDAGSATIHASIVGGVDTSGRPAPWRGRVEVDDVVLTNGDEPVIACGIVNLGQSDVDGLPLVVDARPDDGLVHVAVAVPTLRRRLLRTAELRYEVRRARGRACSVLPHAEAVHLVDDGVSATLTRKRSWWVERSAWAVYVM